jgi:MbtH protein
MDGFEVFVVVVNHEEQYSIWPEELKIPSGWTKVAGPFERSKCLEWIEQTWTDMRPKSLRVSQRSQA